MEAAAIPGVAIPLLQDDCKDTAVDIDWVWNVVHLTSDDRTRRLDLDALRREVDSWFTPERSTRCSARRTATPIASPARGWRARGQALAAVPDGVRLQGAAGRSRAAAAGITARAAVAVECFHKASLVHDDIEDADDERYGRDTLHVEHGVPVALNAGRPAARRRLSAARGLRRAAAMSARSSCGSPPRAIASSASGRARSWLDARAQAAHRRSGARHLPAQDVAGLPGGARVGAALAGAHAETQQVLASYSEALGIAYQIRDDLEDLAADSAAGDGAAGRRSCWRSRASAAKRRGVEGHAASGVDGNGRRPASPTRHSGVGRRGSRARAARGLQGTGDPHAAALQNASLKGLLRRVVGKVFRVEIKGWCSEFETRDAAGRQAGAHAAR